MKINPFNSVNNNPYRKQVEKQESIKDVKQKQDKVEISSAAKEMQESLKIDLARQERVDAIKEQVKSGQYKVNPQEVANRFYDFWNK